MCVQIHFCTAGGSEDVPSIIIHTVYWKSVINGRRLSGWHGCVAGWFSLTCSKGWARFIFCRTTLLFSVWSQSERGRGSMASTNMFLVYCLNWAAVLLDVHSLPWDAGVIPLQMRRLQLDIPSSSSLHGWFIQVRLLFSSPPCPTYTATDLKISATLSILIFSLCIPKQLFLCI